MFVGEPRGQIAYRLYGRWLSYTSASPLLIHSIIAAASRHTEMSIPAVLWDEKERLMLQGAAVCMGVIGADGSRRPRNSAISRTLLTVSKPVELQTVWKRKLDESLNFTSWKMQSRGIYVKELLLKYPRATINNDVVHKFKIDEEKCTFTQCQEAEERWKWRCFKIISYDILWDVWCCHQWWY